MVDYIDPKPYGLAEKAPEPDPEAQRAVWDAMPTPQQNMANAMTRVTLLLDVVWLWLQRRLGIASRPG